MDGDGVEQQRHACGRIGGVLRRFQASFVIERLVGFGRGDVAARKQGQFTLSARASAFGCLHPSEVRGIGIGGDHVLIAAQAQASLGIPRHHTGAGLDVLRGFGFVAVLLK